MYRVAFLLLSSDEEAEEVVQDAFLAVADRWGSLANPGGYLRTVVVNGARRRLRSRVIEVRTAAKLSLGADAATPAPDHDLSDVVDALPERQRIAVVLRYYAGLNSTEIGQLMQCPPATVRSLLRRALADLEEVLGND